MLPSSATPDGTRSSNLRRYGPLAAIVVVIAIIGAIVLVNRGDDKKSTATSSSSSAPLNPVSNTGAITFNDAKAAGRTDLTFPDSCDKTTGQVAIPTTYPPDCFANQPAVTDPGTQGVTNDSITVDVYIAPDDDPILKAITGPIADNDTAAQIEATYNTYNELYQRFYQTYGRKVQFKFLHGSGTSIDPVAARADAVKAAEQDHAFAVLGAPAITDSWTRELNARNVLCIDCASIDDPQPNVFTLAYGSEQGRIQLTEYVQKRLAGKPAKFAGDVSTQTQTRVFGTVYEATNSAPAAAHAADLKVKFAAAGMKLDTQVAYTLATVQQDATTVISQLKSAGVTSVILETDPIAPKTFTEEATRQNYFPEWVIGPSALVDTTAFGRVYDQKQWAHAFGISFLNARIDPEKQDAFSLYRWFTGQDPPAIDTAPVIWPDVSFFYAALQAAGPKLSRETFKDGLFSLKPATGRLTTITISFGNHGFWPTIPDDFWGIDDFTEIWWDPTATGPDEIRKQGTGMLEYSEGGKRFLAGQWTNDTKAFDKNGAITIYTTPPPGEQAKDYPSPAGGGSSSSSSAN